MVFQFFLCIFLGVSHFPWFSYGFPMVFLGFSRLVDQPPPDFQAWQDDPEAAEALGRLRRLCEARGKGQRGEKKGVEHEFIVIYSDL